MPERTISVNQLDFTPRGEVFPSPGDWRDVFIYFLLVDRFDNNQENIPPYDPNTTPRGRDWEQGRVFQGGNLKGIMRRLDYIRGLGANSIWLSPVLKNRIEKHDTYHGYGVQDFLEVDPRFGTKEDLQELVRQAHARNIYVIMDIIISHTGDNWGYPGDHPYPPRNLRGSPCDGNRAVAQCVGLFGAPGPGDIRAGSDGAVSVCGGGVHVLHWPHVAPGQGSMRQPDISPTHAPLGLPLNSPKEGGF